MDITPPATTEPTSTAAIDTPPFGGRTVLRTCADYAEAQKVVDTLSDEGFAVENLMIVGEGLNMVEQVVGRLTWPRVLLQGAISGAFLGLTFMLILSFFRLLTLGDLLRVLAYGAGLGAIIGMITRAIGYAATGGARDFQTVGGMKASRYLVLIDGEHADNAQTILADRSL